MKKKAYAKVNLYLNIGKLNDNGLHEIDSIVDRINIYDIVKIKKSRKIKVKAKGIKQEDNLCYKAACLLKETYNYKNGCIIKIKKHIPIKAGLGGGSSDAAVTLKILNNLWKINAPLEELIPLAHKVGSDCPALMLDGPARIRGTGDSVREINSNIDLFYLIITFKNGCSTKDVYSNYNNGSIDATLNCALEDAIINKKYDYLLDNMYNDLTYASTIIDTNSPHPLDIIEDLNIMTNKTYKALLLGSGSSVVVASASSEDILKVKEYLRENNIDAMLVTPYK